MTVRDRLSVVSALAVLLAASALQPVYSSWAWLPRAVGAVVLVTLVAAVARRIALPRPLQPVLSLLALAGYLLVVFAGSSLSFLLLPGGDAVRAVGDLFQGMSDDLSQYGPPAPVTPSLGLLAVGGVGLVAVAVDTIASTLHRPALAGLPLLALFAVPSAVLPDGLGWIPFALGAAGWLGLLLVEGREEALRWGSSVLAPGSPAAPGPSGPYVSPVGTVLPSGSVRTTGRPGSSAASGLGRVGRRIGGVALGVAVLVPALVPGLNTRLLDGGEGGGGGGTGGRSVTTYNPITRLRGELTLPEPTEVLTYRTNDPDPDYLRMTTLGVYDGAGWRQDVLRGNLRDNGVDNPIPEPVGRSSVAPSRQVAAEISITSLDAFWLPLPATPSTLKVQGPWMWDAGSQSVFATRSNTSKVDSYTVNSSRVLPDPAQLAAGDAAVPAEIAPYATMVDATETVRSLTTRIIRGQTTDYGRAKALQDFFRNPANKFTYAEDTTTGGSPDALEDFLQQRQGFCEQYASAMGAMLRLAGVPSRVAVGFTPGKRQADGSYAVTTDEAHAWPEAWFEGAGWVRFEPTPSQGGITPPVYSQQQGQTTELPDDTEVQAPVTEPGQEDAAETPAEREARLEAEREEGLLGAGTSDSSGNGGSRVPAIALGVGAGVLLVVALPGLLHLARRRRRWRRATPQAAWAQLRDDTTDSGQQWRPAESPRAAAARLVHEGGLTGSAADALRRLSTAVEQSRYARPGVSSAAGTDLRADARTVRKALHAGTNRRRRIRAVLLPPSTLAWAGSWAGSRIADLLDATDAAVSAVGTRLRRRSA